MITTVQMRIQNGTFRDHALEQGATVHEVAQYLRDEAAAALGRLNFRAVAVAVLSDSEISFPVEVRDPYADIEAEDDMPAAALTDGGATLDVLRDVLVGD